MEKAINEKHTFDSKKLAYLCAEKLFEKHAERIHILDLKGLSDIADFFVIASANSQIHLKSLAEVVEEVFDFADISRSHVEGMKALQWVLADAYDVIVHLFLPEAREFYNIESYWGDAPVEIIEESEPDVAPANPSSK